MLPNFSAGDIFPSVGQYFQFLIIYYKKLENLKDKKLVKLVIRNNHHYQDLTFCMKFIFANRINIVYYAQNILQVI